MTPLITPGDLVRDVLARYPATAEVLARSGLEGCGGREGPAERLDVFAAAHQLPVEALLQALNEAAKRAPVPAPPRPAPERATPPDDLFRPFLLAALLSTLTLGATYGAMNLLTIHLGLAAWPYFN